MLAFSPQIYFLSADDAANAAFPQGPVPRKRTRIRDTSPRESENDGTGLSGRLAIACLRN
jgi:hypothetical protein